MKAILEFNLDDHDDRLAHMRCVKALDMSLALWEIKYNLKRKLENSFLDEEKDDMYFKALDTIFDKICDEINDRGINLDDLVV